MRFESLNDWLVWQQSLNINAIELGLERVSAVASRMQIGNIANKVIIVAGTNGKGSTVAGYETWLHNAGYSVASYTSPHLLSYNERIKLNRQLANDEQICAAFAAIDQARGDILLTYFEFGTLAALWLIQRMFPDYAILEVGLGGRLDAVNIIDADMVHLTSIGLDHQNWLGNDRETIGFEKAGVLRAAIPVICNDIDVPESVQREIQRLDCKAYQYRRDFTLDAIGAEGMFRWKSADLEIDLKPILAGRHQIQNLAGVIAGLHQLVDLSGFSRETVQENFSGLQLPGRFQRLDSVTGTTIYADVGHNEDAAAALAVNLAEVRNPEGRVVVLLGMLDDKDHRAFVRRLRDIVDEWWLVSLPSDRGLDAAGLNRRIKPEVNAAHQFDTVEGGLNEALSSLGNHDIMLVTGSFLTVEQCLLALSDRN